MKRSLGKLFLVVAVETVIILGVAELQYKISTYASNALFGSGFDYVLFVRILPPLLMIALFMTLGISTILISRVCPLWKSSGGVTRAGYIIILVFTAAMMFQPYLILPGDGAFYEILARTKLQFFLQISSLTYLYAALFIAMVLPNIMKKSR